MRVCTRRSNYYFTPGHFARTHLVFGGQKLEQQLGQLAGQLADVTAVNGVLDVTCRQSHTSLRDD